MNDERCSDVYPPDISSICLFPFPTPHSPLPTPDIPRRGFMLKGAIHLHSVYSDGEFTLAELREALVAAGCPFACMTDHAEYFNRLMTRDYVAECASLSDDRFRFIPGLEYSCYEGMHVLGLGVTEAAGTRDPQDVIRLTRERGGV